MIRTWLFVPGHEPYKIRKALASGADAVIIDWEDAVPQDQKEQARTTTQTELAQAETSSYVVIRVNSPKSAWFAEDLPFLKALKVSALMVPKADDPTEIRDLATANVPLIPLIESGLGVELAFVLAQAHPLVERLAFGPLDLLADLGAHWTPGGEALSYARARLVIAARAGGLLGMIDGIYPNLADLAGLRKETELARILGCEGKMLLHPKQLAVVRDVFRPTEEEIKRARLIIQAAEEAARTSHTVVQLDGMFIDPPVVRRAYQTLQETDEV